MVKELFEVQLKTSGINDVSLYMDRFDALYEQGKMEHLIPEGEQNRILENIPFTEWKNPYIDANARETDRVETEVQEEKQTGRISIKEKLAEKKAVIEQRDKEVPEKGTEKKSEREI